jgi:fructose-1,6-bisphosphatase II
MAATTTNHPATTTNPPTAPWARASAAGIGALIPAALAATRAAAIACQAWIGRGERRAADAAATKAMRAALANAPGSGTVIIGEGEKDDAPMLFNGERVGTGLGPEFDIAVDPLEGTNLCATAAPGAMATIAFAQAGSLWSPGPAFYMDKLVVGRHARGAIDISRSPEENITRIARALDRRVREVHVVVLDKPRHAGLIARIRDLGAQVATPTDGDVGGALATLVPGGGADVLMGVGGTPEGVMTACAVRALGGEMQARLAPQLADEAAAIDAAGMDVDRVLVLDDLASGPSCFVATGVTSGPLLRAPRRSSGPSRYRTESFVITRQQARRVIR